MQPQNNLAKFVNWTELGRELGFLGDAVKALPAHVACPYCRLRPDVGNSTSRSSIFHHFTLGGQWHRCTGCGHQGDLISLAAKVWGVDIPAAVARCCRLQLLPDGQATREAVEKYLAGLRFEAAVRDVWAEAAAGPLYHPASQHLLRLSGWRAAPEVDWRASGIDQLIGCLPATRIEELLGGGPGTERGRSVFRHGVVVDPSIGHIFPGAGWRRSLVVPFYDLPGRIVGFHLRGRALLLDKDQFFCCADPDRGEYCREGGIQTHPDLFDHGGDLIGFSAIHWYLRLQSRHLEKCPTPLPLFGWQCGPGLLTVTGWQALAARRLVLWEPRLTTAALSAAIRHDAALALCPAADKTPPGVAAWLKELQPSDFVGYTLEAAKAWPELLAELRQREPGHFESLVEAVASEAELLERLQQECDGATIKAVKALVRKSRPHRSVSYGGRLIERRKDGLYLLARHRPGLLPEAERICSGNIRLEKLVWYPESKDADYIGQLTSQGRSLEFSVERSVLRDRAAAWLEETSLAAGLAPVQCAPGWAAKLHDLALLFHAPEPEIGFEQVGWSASQAAFILPRWKIDYGGRCQSHRLFRRTPATPGDIVPEDGMRGSLLPKLLVDTQANRDFWGLYVELLGLVLLPALDAEPANLLLAGPVNDLAAAVASAFQSPALRRDLWSAELAGLRHNWPIWLPGPFGPKGWPAVGLSTAVAAVSWPEALSLGVSNLQPGRIGGRHRVLTRPKAFTPPEVTDCSGLGWLLFEYLRRVCATQFSGVTRETYAEHFWSFVGDVSGAQPGFQPAGWREYGAEEGASELLARLVGWMVAEGYASQLPRSSRDSKNALWFENDLLFIPKTLVRQCLREEGCNDAPIEHLSQRLLSEARIKGEEFVNGHVCWVVSGKWLFKFANEERNEELGHAAVRLAR